MQSFVVIIVAFLFLPSLVKANSPKHFPFVSLITSKYLNNEKVSSSS